MLTATISGLGFLCAEESDSGKLWSLQALGNPTPPPVEKGAWGRNAVDAFILRDHNARNLSPGAPADRRKLMRRVSYGLSGLPPATSQVEKFIADPRSDAEAFQTIVEDLLASKHYGERWGRHWLDVVRYADTAGENSDHPLPHVWRYRNWVIDAFNQDKAYDDFVREQLVGDLLAGNKAPQEQSANIIATGYLALARRFGHDIDQSMHLTYEDAIDNLGKAFLGLSISCARCHDHKHDPILMRDYYSLYAMLDSTRFSFPGCEPKQQPRDLIPIGNAELQTKREVWEKTRRELQALADAGGAAETQRVKELSAKGSKILSQGDVPDGGSVHVTPEPITLSVRKGEAIHLSILPQANYGADTTILDFTITYRAAEGEIHWSLADLIDNLTLGNPHDAKLGAQWCFLNTANDEPHFLTGRMENVQGKPALRAWEDDAPPSILVNTSKDPVMVWTTLPGRTFFVHPGPEGPVAIAWLSPINGQVEIDLKVSDGHPGGDGVGWQLEHFADPKISEAYLALAKSTASRSKHLTALREHDAMEPQMDLAYAVAEGEPKKARLQERGDPEVPGESVPREYLAILGGGPLGDGRSSGRLELAERIASADNPLTARVMVNRIWAWHFGRGLVATPNDFGNHGQAPSHPELLDYLARYFIEHDWSVKAMHRLILSSATYQQAASDGITPGTFSAFTHHRLSAEELRDTLLIAAGTLDLSPGQSHPFPAEQSWSFTQHAPFVAEYASNRRSIYLMRKRNRNSAYFALFDGADPNASTAERGVTTPPTQALYFMNDPFFHDCAERFAVRIRAAAPDTSGRLDFACRELFSRPARGEEVTAFEEFAATLASAIQGDATAIEIESWSAWARILLASNELLHTD